jgi:hypothetical protein
MCSDDRPDDLVKLMEEAEQGYADAQNSLGVCYLKGKGHVQAQTSLGICCRDGKGVLRDMAQATEWFRKTPSFPPPPIPGNDDIQPVTDAVMLLEEGRTMHHCVAGYVVPVLDGDCYIYRVLKPARATLELRPIIPRAGTPQAWHISQIKGYCNAKPIPGVTRAVRDWLRKYMVGTATPVGMTAKIFSLFSSAANSCHRLINSGK